MRTIKIIYKGEAFKTQLSRIKAFPNDVLKIDFDKYPQLVEVMESPVYITEKPDRLSFTEVQNNEQSKLLMSFGEGIIHF